MKKTERVILSVGQVRNESVFSRQLEEIHNLLEAGDISRSILCTQEGNISDGQMEEASRLGTEVITVSRLTADNIRVLDPSIEKRKSGIRQYSGGLSSGTPWIQLRTFRLGLNEINKLAVVLKIRPDVHISGKVMQSFFDTIENSANSKNAEESFVGKFLVQWFSVSQPLYIDDMVFGGYWRDLDTMVNGSHNSHLANFYPPASLPSMFWIEPFLTYAPSFREIALNYLQLPFSPKLILRKDFRSLLGAYLTFANKNLIIPTGDIARYMQWSLNTPNYKIWNTLEDPQDPIASIMRSPSMQNAIDSQEELGKTIPALRDDLAKLTLSIATRAVVMEMRHWFMKGIRKGVGALSGLRRFQFGK